MNHLPERHLSDEDASRLSWLIATRQRSHPYEREDLDELEEALAGAHTLPVAALPPECVTLGSRVTVQMQREEASTAETIVIVEPLDAQPGQGRVSVLSPLGRALIGLRAGQRVGFTLPGGRTAEVEVLGVERDAQSGASRVEIPS
jgi:regulator of nucleoside diphosphate kinase